MRLALTVVACILIGYDRSEHGKPAGMRTMLLVGLAASVAMLQVNLLLPMAGRPPGSFVMNDLMRLPLGILTGVGFIGGGAILRRDTIIVGVTTAATLWIVTVIGLCFGGGQIGLGLVATGIALFALWILKWFESGLQRESRARFSIELDASGSDEAQIRGKLHDAGLSIIASRVFLEGAAGHRRYAFELREVHQGEDRHTPAIVGELAGEPGVLTVLWHAL
ncbi:MAG: MgtC/SapB family protein [Candidatus Binataceae bacterium]